MDNLDALSSDEEFYEQNGDHVKFVRNGEIELELKYDQLEFKFCSDGCMGKVVIACYDSTNSNHLRQGGCDPGQCEFKAGVSEVGENKLLWFSSIASNTLINDHTGICKIAIMEYPQATPNGILKFASCEPLKHDGNVVKLYVHQVPPGCPFYVQNANKWTPPPPTIATTSTEITESNEPAQKSSEANTSLWIVIGVGIFILLIVVIGFGYFCYRTQIQKKPLFGKKKDVQQKDFIPEASKKTIFIKEKTADEKEVVAKPEPSKESTVEKEKQPKPTKKKASKEKKAQAVVPKSSKEITQENGTKEDAQPKKKVSIEPTLENPTTETSVVRKSVVQQKQRGNSPRVFVPKKVILPARKSVNAPKNKSHSSKKDSLSGRHESEMQIMVVSSLDSLSEAENDETQNSKHASEKLRKKESAGGRKKGSKKRR